MTNREYFRLMPTRKEYLDHVTKLSKRMKFLGHDVKELNNGRVEGEKGHLAEEGEGEKSHLKEQWEEVDLHIESPILPYIGNNSTSTDKIYIPEVILLSIFVSS